jgi:hypothetical protein
MKGTKSVNTTTKPETNLLVSIGITLKLTSISPRDNLGLLQGRQVLEVAAGNPHDQVPVLLGGFLSGFGYCRSFFRVLTLSVVTGRGT